MRSEVNAFVHREGRLSSRVRGDLLVAKQLLEERAQSFFDALI
jgi:hypothetical protein